MALHSEDSRFVCDFVRRAAAIALEPDKEHLLETRLASVASQLGLADVAELLRELRTGRRGALAQAVVDGMTTNETSFFRDIAPFDHLRRSVIPRLIEARARERELVLWCAAASSGQEPYSLLMLLREEFPQLANWSIRFLATDISQHMLARCRDGLYSQLEVERGLPAHLLAKYFQKQGLDWRIDEQLRQSIEWREFNLAGHGWGTLPQFDLILVRNVLIYFDPSAQRSVLGALRRVLRPDGYLFLGTAETTTDVDARFQSEQAQSSCFRLRVA